MLLCCLSLSVKSCKNWCATLLWIIVKCWMNRCFSCMYHFLVIFHITEIKLRGSLHDGFEVNCRVNCRLYFQHFHNQKDAGRNDFLSKVDLRHPGILGRWIRLRPSTISKMISKNFKFGIFKFPLTPVDVGAQWGDLWRTKALRAGYRSGGIPEITVIGSLPETVLFLCGLYILHSSWGK